MFSFVLAVLWSIWVGLPAHAAEDPVYSRAVDLIEHRYLRIDEFDAAEAFDEAAEAAEDAVPWLIAETEGGVVHLAHGESGEFAMVAIGIDEQGRALIGDLDAALGRLQSAIERGPDALPDEVDLKVELLRGVSRALDRHSVVLAKRRLERFDERIKGKLTGIGATIGMVDGELTVKEVFASSPAERGGLLDGDIIVRIDGISTVGMSVQQSVRRIRGPEDTSVLIEVERIREGGRAPVVLSFTRAEVVIPVVRSEVLPSGVGIVSISHFSEHTARLLRGALIDFADQQPPLRGIVLDLRGNSGGSMIQACRSADLFVESGVIIRTAGRNGERVDNLLREYLAHDDKIEPRVPVVVLIDHKSASASEILAGALTLLDRAVIIGDRSHGKGTVQKLFSLRGGGDDQRVRFKLTVAEYLLEGGVPIEAGIGLDPDLQVAQATFQRGGVWLPHVVDDEEPDLVYVDELRGWREFTDGGPVDGAPNTVPPTHRDDFLVDLGARILLASDGSHRQDTLDALDRVLAAVEVEEDLLLVRTFGYRGLDWRRADEDADGPVVDVKIEVVDRPIAGNDTEVRALVENLGTAPLYRVRVVLDEGGRLPWSGVNLPVGYLPPGGQGLGSAVVSIDDDVPDREDLVGAVVYADRRPPTELDPVLLGVEGRPAPPMAVTARLVPHEEAWRAELELENRGEGMLTGLSARFALPEDDSVELLDREGLLPLLKPGTTERTDIALRITEPREELELELRVDAEVYGRVLRVPLTLPVDGAEVRVEPPSVDLEAPLAAPTGPLVLSARARDDREVRSITAWMHGHKVFWREGSGRRLAVDIPISVEEGTQAVIVEVRDDQDAVTRRYWYVRGIPATDAADSSDAE